MKMNKAKYTSKPLKAVLGGVVISFAASVIITGLLGIAFVNGVINEGRIMLTASATQLLAVLLGGVFAGKRYGKKYILLTSSVGCLYYLITVATTLLAWGGKFNGFGTGTIMCVLGVLGATALCLLKPRESKHRKRKL